MSQENEEKSVAAVVLLDGAAFSARLFYSCSFFDIKSEKTSMLISWSGGSAKYFLDDEKGRRQAIAALRSLRENGLVSADWEERMASRINDFNPES